METYIKTLVLALIDAGIVYWLFRHVPRTRFHALKWPLVAASGIFWGLFCVILLWVFWESYYQSFEPDWARWAAPVGGIEYALAGLLFWWLAHKLPGPSVITFIVLGMLESIPEHALGIYVFKILELPILKGETPLSIFSFALFEYGLYWSAVVGVALLLDWIWRHRRTAAPLGTAGVK